MNNNDLLNNAIILATQAHKGQIDKGGNNYILHPIRLMLKCETLEEQIVAVCHDIIEDTCILEIDLISSGFSKEIIDAIYAITRRTNETYFDFIKRCKQNPIAKVVKLADLEDNMNLARIPNITEKDYSRLKRYEKAQEILLEEE